MKASFYPIVSLWLLVSCGLTTTNSTSKYNAAEHKLLGDNGYEAACRSFADLCPASLVRADRLESFSYGELVAFSGDLYETWEELYNADADQFSQLLNLRKSWDNVGKLKDIVDQEQSAVLAMQRDPSVVYPDYNIDFLKVVGPAYLELSTNNTEHFGWHNQKAYVTYHGRALELAVQGYHSQDANDKAARLQEALFANAFADHFLTDGFAAGHIRMPRRESLTWGERQSPDYSAQSLGILAKVIHDNDPCIYQSGLTNSCRGDVGPGPWRGRLKVKNARGDLWSTPADGDLYRSNDATVPAIRLPIAAVEASLREVLQAFTSGQTPSGVYAATTYVPFASPGEIPLAVAFQAPFTDNEIDGLLSSIGFLGSPVGRVMVGLINPERTRDYLHALPEIMQNFRDNIEDDLASQPELRERLPDAYIEAYRNVH